MSGNALSILVSMSNDSPLDKEEAVKTITDLIQNNPKIIFEFYDVLGEDRKRVFNQKFPKILARADKKTIDKYYLHLFNFHPERIIEKLKEEGLSPVVLGFLSRNTSEALHKLLGLEFFEVKQIIYNLWGTEFTDLLLGKYIVDEPGDAVDADIRRFLLEIIVSDESGIFVGSLKKLPRCLQYSDLFSNRVESRLLVSFIKNSEHLFLQPKDDEEIPLESNPIMLAAKFKKYEVLMHAYDNANKKPWSIYWKQISEEGGYIKTYLDEVVSIMVREGEDEAKFSAFIKEKLYVAAGIKAEKLLRNFDAKESGDVFAKCLMLHPAMLDDYVLTVIRGDSNASCKILGNEFKVRAIDQLLDKVLDVDDELLKRVLFDYILESGNPALLYQLLSGRKGPALVKHAWNYFKNNAGKVLSAFEGAGLSIGGLSGVFEQNLTDAKLSFSKIIPPLSNHETILRILPWIDVPNGNDTEVDPLENPLIIAAKTGFGKKIIEYAFTNRENEPWKTYWSQCGDSENSVIVHCFKFESTKVFKWLLDNESVIRDLNYDGVVNMRSAARRDYRLVKKAELLSYKIGNGYMLDPLYSIDRTVLDSIDNRLESWMLWRMVYQRGDNSSLRFEGAESANDTKFASKICGVISLKLLNEKLEARYAGVADKLGVAREDHRLFMIMQFLKYGPDVGSHEYAAWVELVKLCGFSVADINDEFKNMTFLQFRTLVGNKPRFALISNVIKDRPSRGASEDARRLLSLLATRNAWKTVGNLQNNFGNFKSIEIVNFTLTCMLIVTDDVDEELSKVDNMEQLLKLIEKQPLVIRNIIKKSADFSEAKSKVRTLLLQAQKSMEYSLMEQAVECCLANGGRGSCPTGIYNRFGRNVINLHNKYSMVQPGGREDFISDFITEEFKIFVRRYMLALYCKNLDKAKISIDKIKKLREARTMASFKTILQTYTPEEIKAVVQIIPDMTDAEPSKFMDAIFSVAADEWYKLYVGDRKVLSYSSVLAEKEVWLSAKDINSERQRLLNECFRHIRSNLKKQLQDNGLSADLSKLESELLSYKCRTLENRKTLDQIAGDIYKFHSDIKALAAEPELVLSPVEKFSHEAEQGLIRALSKPTTTQALVVAPKKKRLAASTLMNMFLKPRTVKAKAVNTALAMSAPTASAVNSRQLAKAMHDLILSEYGKSITGDRQIVIDPESSYSGSLSAALTQNPDYWKNQDGDDIEYSIIQFTKYLCNDQQIVAELQALIADPRGLTARFLQILANKIAELDSKLKLTGNNLTMHNLLLRIHEQYVAKPVSLDDVEPPPLPKPVLFNTEVQPETIETKSAQTKSPLIPPYPTLGKTAGSFAGGKLEGESKTTVQIKPKDGIRYYPEIQKTTGNLAAEVKPKQEEVKPKQEVAKQEPAPTGSKPLTAVQQRIAELNRVKTGNNTGNNKR